MQYFTKELWRDMNDEREWIRGRAAKEWTANSRRYYAKFETIKKRLPEKFVAELLARDGFHDYDFLEINFVSKKNIISKKVTYSCELKLTDGKDIVRLELLSVTGVSIAADSFADGILGRLTWGYGEFDVDSDGNLQLSIVCDLANEMRFSFKKLRFTCKKRKGLLR